MKFKLSKHTKQKLGKHHYQVRHLVVDSSNLFLVRSNLHNFMQQPSGSRYKLLNNIVNLNVQWREGKQIEYWNSPNSGDMGRDLQAAQSSARKSTRMETKNRRNSCFDGRFALFPNFERARRVCCDVQLLAFPQHSHSMDRWKQYHLYKLIITSFKGRWKYHYIS
jgi:hypothetical protein